MTGIKTVIGFLVVSFLLVFPWRWFPLPTSSFMLQSLLSTGQSYQYRWTSYERISPYMGLAAIAAEDQRFPSHNGFDWEALRTAAENYRAGYDAGGGSTISQQVAKNLYLWSGRSLLRKGLEAWFTMLIEWMWSKQRILEVYINVAQFSKHVFGVGAASRQFFGVAATDLSPDEAALLAAVLPGPEIYYVDQPSWEVLDRQGWIIRQMNQLGLNILEDVKAISSKENPNFLERTPTS
jgi:monofunctional glycosyltransferase